MFAAPIEVTKVGLTGAAPATGAAPSAQAASTPSAAMVLTMRFTARPLIRCPLKSSCRLACPAKRTERPTRSELLMSLPPLGDSARLLWDDPHERAHRRAAHARAHPTALAMGPPAGLRPADRGGSAESGHP